MNRRNFLTLGRPQDGLAHSDGGRTQSPPIFAKRTDAGLEAYTGPWTYKEAAHLLRRCMIGPTDADIRTAVSEGLDATLEKLFLRFNPRMDLIQDWAGQDPQIRADAADYQAWQTELFRRRETVTRWWGKTIATSPVSMQEWLVLFWHGHFTSEMQVVNFAEWMLGQNQLFRQNMLGNFKQMTKDVTKDVAMLFYLDGLKNFKSGNRNNINENYGRELMELYTCGVVDWDGNPNYTQADVSEAARALSGWVIAPSSKGNYYAGLTSQFVPTRWDSGQKTLMGQTGAWQADDVVDIIFAQRGDQVSKYICEKLYRALIYDIADRDVVTGMAETMRNSNWEVRPVIEQLLKSAHFYDETNIGAIQRSPAQYLIAMVRGWGLENIPDFDPAVSGRGSQDLGGRMTTLGMTLFDPPDVKGWRAGRTWVSTSTVPVRQKFGIDVAKGLIRVRGTNLYTFDAVAFAKSFPDYNDIRKLNANMAQFILNVQPSDAEKQMLLDTLLAGGVNYEWDIDDPNQKADERIRKFLEAAVQLAKFQLY